MKRKTRTTPNAGNCESRRTARLAWAEDVAKEFVRRSGHLVVDDDPARATGSRRPAFSFVAWDEHCDEMVFVRVVPLCDGDTADDVRPQLPTKARMARARREAKRWSEHPDMKWKGRRRFDRIAVYGKTGTDKATVDWTVGAKGEL